MTNILDFTLKSRGVVGRVAHAKSSDPATPSKFGTCTCSNRWAFQQCKSHLSLYLPCMQLQYLRMQLGSMG